MFFSYPIEAVANNWLHDSLSEMIKSLKEAITAGTVPADWPAIIPDSRREELKIKHAFRDLWKEFVRVLVALPKGDALDTISAFESQNKVETLLNGTSICMRTSDLPASIQKPAKDLFTFAYQLVRDGDIRATAYKIIDDNRRQKMCPFCGYEPMSAVDLPKDALDHYLCKDKYPFAAANLRNLAPIGHKCNSLYKGEKDVLRKLNGTPRKAFDPFACTPVSMSQVLDTLDPATKGINWSLKFDGDQERIDTWLDVFSILERFEKEILNDYESWLREFGVWARTEMVNSGSTNVRQFLVSYGNTCFTDNFSERGFVRRPFFNRIIELFDTDEAVQKYVENLVNFSLPAPV